MIATWQWVSWFCFTVVWCAAVHFFLRQMRVRARQAKELDRVKSDLAKAVRPRSLNQRGDVFYRCPAGHGDYRADRKYCLACTEANLEASKDFQHVCACPQCGTVEAHPWDSIGAGTEVPHTMVAAWYGRYSGNGITITDPSYVVRRCGTCEYTWSQL